MMQENFKVRDIDLIITDQRMQKETGVRIIPLSLYPHLSEPIEFCINRIY